MRATLPRSTARNARSRSSLELAPLSFVAPSRPTALLAVPLRPASPHAHAARPPAPAPARSAGTRLEEEAPPSDVSPLLRTLLEEATRSLQHVQARWRETEEPGSSASKLRWVRILQAQHLLEQRCVPVLMMRWTTASLLQESPSSMLLPRQSSDSETSTPALAPATLLGALSAQLPSPAQQPEPHWRSPIQREVRCCCRRG
jgi:hypothetical protein